MFILVRLSNCSLPARNVTEPLFCVASPPTPLPDWGRGLGGEALLSLTPLLEYTRGTAIGAESSHVIDRPVVEEGRV